MTDRVGDDDGEEVPLDLRVAELERRLAELEALVMRPVRGDPPDDPAAR